MTTRITKFYLGSLLFLLREVLCTVGGDGFFNIGMISAYSILQKSPIPPRPSALDMALEPPLPLEP
jgi:hypothetical protein